MISIIKDIQETIKETIPNAKPSKLAKPYWTTKSAEEVRDTRRARRTWKTSALKKVGLNTRKP